MCEETAAKRASRPRRPCNGSKSGMTLLGTGDGKVSKSEGTPEANRSQDSSYDDWTAEEVRESTRNAQQAVSMEAVTH